MNLLGKVIWWEFSRHIRNKQFLIGLFITPLLFALFAGVPVLLERFDRPQEHTFLVVDDLGILPALEERLSSEGTINLQATNADPDVLRAAVLEGEADGYFVLDASFVESGNLPIYVDKMRHRPEALVGALTTVFQSIRMQEEGIDSAVLAYVSVRPAVYTQALDTPTETVSPSGLPMAIGFSAMLFFLIMASGSMLLQSALQEKRDRMSEVILSSVAPDTLMGGKIIAHFLLGIFQICFWLAIGLPIAYFLLDIPLGKFITPSLLPLFTLFVLLGYLFFAALFVGIGATMEDLQSASNSQGMIFMLPALSFFVLGPVINNPEGTIARIATFFPVTSPIITILRTGFSTVPTWEILTACVIMLVSTWIVVKLSAKLFRTGMLMYGKNATLSEIWKWLRHA